MSVNERSLAGWYFRRWLNWMHVRECPRHWWCRWRGGHVYERYYGDAPLAPRMQAEYICVRCYHCISIRSE